MRDDGMDKRGNLIGCLHHFKIPIPIKVSKENIAPLEWLGEHKKCITIHHHRDIKGRFSK